MSRGILVRLRAVTLLVLLLAFAFGSTPAALAGQANREAAPTDPPPAGTTPATVQGQEPTDPTYKVESITLSDGRQVERVYINGPSEPPPGYELERAPVPPSALNRPGVAYTLPVPAYNWVFGCGAVSGAMIAAYFDRNGFPNMYTGPTNGGLMPMDNSVWPTFTDGVGATYRLNPLVASRNGLDGRATRGSIDDYWVASNSTAKDPYITGGWAQHTWGDAVGDYMKTSQSAYDNVDGSSWFYWGSGGSYTCAAMAADGVADWDATYGRKLFYEARGYTVTECYNQKTDNNGGGFTFANYKAQIDAGYPVFIMVEGHFMVGVGYDQSTTPPTVYLNDTWDYDTHQMPWGGSYSGRKLLAAGVVNPAGTITPKPTITGLNPSSATPGGPGFTLTVNGTGFVSNSVVRWNGSDRATTYVNATRLTATITSADIQVAKTASVTVYNPGTGGGTSNAVSFVVGTMRKTFLPMTLKAHPPGSGPNPGYWLYPQGPMEFYVTADRAFVDDFAMYIVVEGCGYYKITHVVPEPISGKSFGFTGPFYASGTFSSQTKASGTLGLDDFYISGCGWVTTPTWTWAATWQQAAQVVAAEAVERDRVEPASPGKAFEVTRVR